MLSKCPNCGSNKVFDAHIGKYCIYDKAVYEPYKVSLVDQIHNVVCSNEPEGCDMTFKFKPYSGEVTFDDK